MSNIKCCNLKIGLVGCGNWGKNILRDLLILGCQVIVADINPKRCDYAISKGASAAVLSIEELPSCDAYVVATTIPELTPTAAKLLTRKKPIFCEKTLCRSLEDFEKLKALDGLQYIFAMHKWHYHPGIEALRTVALSGEIGDLEQICTVKTLWMDDFHGGDVFWTLAVHDLTIIKHIAGSIPSIKYAKKICSTDGFSFALIAVFDGHVSALMQINGHHSNKRSGVSIHGRLGSAELFDAYDDHIILKTQKEIKRIPIDTTFPLYLELKEFINYLSGGSRPRCDLFSAKEVTQVILQLIDSADERSIV